MTLGLSRCAWWKAPIWSRVSALKIPPETETMRAQGVLECVLLSRKSEHLVLPRPFRGRVDKASHCHSSKQPALDRSLDEIRSEECEGDGHVDLADAASLALGDAFDGGACVIDKFLEPAAPARDRGDQGGASLGAEHRDTRAYLGPGSLFGRFVLLAASCTGLATLTGVADRATARFFADFDIEILRSVGGGHRAATP